MANSATVGVLRAILTANTAEFDTAMKDGAAAVQQFSKDVNTHFGGATQSLTQGTGGAIASLGNLRNLLIGLGVTKAAGEFLQAASHLQDLSAATGIGTTELQRLQFAAGQTGTTLDQVVRAVQQMQNRLGSGDQGAVGALRQLGLNLDTIRTLDPGKQFETIATSISKVPDPMQRTALAMDLFGRGGGAILPTLTADITALGDQAQIMSEKTVAAGDAADDSWNQLMNTGTALIGNALAPMTPLLTSLTRAFELASPAISSAVKALTDFILPINQFSREVDLAREHWELFWKTLDNPAIANADANWKNLQARVQDLPTMLKEAETASKDLEQAQTKAARAAELHAQKIAGLRQELTGAGAIQLARDYLVALRDVKDISKLTEDAQAQINRVMADAIAVYQAAGRDVPPEIDKMWRATNNLVAKSMEIRTVIIPALKDMHSELLSMSSLDLSNIDIQQAVNTTADAFVRHADETRRATAEVSTWATQLGQGVQGAVQTMQTAISGAFAQMMIGATSFKDGWTQIWNSIKQTALNIFNQILQAFIGNLLQGMIGALTGQQGAFAGLFGGLFGGGGGGGLGGIFGGLFGGGGGGGGGMWGLPTVWGPGAAGPAIGGGAAGGSGGLFSGGLLGIGSIGTLGLGAGISALLMGILRGGLFRGGEEALHVNQPRDQFIQQTVAGILANTNLLQGHGQPGEFGTAGGTGPGSAFHSLAAALQQMGNTALFGSGAVQGGQAAFQSLLSADTVAEYQAAVQQINGLLLQWQQHQQAVAQATEDTATSATDAASATTQVAQDAAATADSAATAATAASDALQANIVQMQQQADHLQQTKDSLLQSIQNEAPEEVMGVVEQQVRDQIALIEQQQADLQTTLNQAVADAAAAADVETRVVEDAATTAIQTTGDTATAVALTTETTVTGISGTLKQAADNVVLGWDQIEREMFAFSASTTGEIYGNVIPAMQALYDMTILVAQGASPSGFRGIGDEARAAGRDARDGMDMARDSLESTYRGTVELAEVFRVLGREVQVSAAQMDKIRREGFTDRQAADWLRDQASGTARLGERLDGVVERGRDGFREMARDIESVGESIRTAIGGSLGEVSQQLSAFLGRAVQLSDLDFRKISAEGWNLDQAAHWWTRRGGDGDFGGREFGMRGDGYERDRPDGAASPHVEVTNHYPSVVDTRGVERLIPEITRGITDLIGRGGEARTRFAGALKPGLLAVGMD